jgi:hypothetical protein
MRGIREIETALFLALRNKLLSQAARLLRKDGAKPYTNLHSKREDLETLVVTAPGGARPFPRTFNILPSP